MINIGDRYKTRIDSFEVTHIRSNRTIEITWDDGGHGLLGVSEIENFVDDGTLEKVPRIDVTLDAELFTI